MTLAPPRPGKPLFLASASGRSAPSLTISAAVLIAATASMPICAVGPDRGSSTPILTSCCACADAAPLNIATHARMTILNLIAVLRCFRIRTASSYSYPISPPFIPPQAGIQGPSLRPLGPRFRGDERRISPGSNAKPHDNDRVAEYVCFQSLPSQVRPTPANARVASLIGALFACVRQSVQLF